MRAIKHKHHVIAMFAVGEGCPDPCVCKWGGGCTPPTLPTFVKPIHACNKKHKHHVITMCAVREGCADHYMFAHGGAAPPPTPPLF